MTLKVSKPKTYKNLPKNPTVKAICLDWLELNMTQSGKLEGDVFTSRYFSDKQNSIEVGKFSAICNPNMRSRVFSTAHEIYYEGIHFATVMHSPYTNVIKQYGDVSVKIENSFLYANWHKILIEMTNAFQLTLHNIKRMDIACDGFSFLRPMDLVRKDRLETVGNAMVKFVLRGKKGVKSFDIGSRSSDRYARCYHKQEEIDQHSKKYYINKFWKKQGIQETEFDNMERLEIVLKSKEINRLGKVDWRFIQSLCNPITLTNIAKTNFKRLYEFREPTSQKKNVTRAKRRYQIEFTYAGKLLRKATRMTAKRIRSMQTTIKNAYQLYLKTGKSHYHNLADEIMLNCDLTEWFDKRRTAFLYEYELALKNDKPFISLYNEITGHYTRPEFGTVLPTRRKIVL